jgi:hypothetical protein
MRDRAVEVARQEAINMGDDPDRYEVRIQEDADSWRVVFTPRERVRGGGFEVRVDKVTQQVREVLRYQ